jgi:hypothetical protein
MSLADSHHEARGIALNIAKLPELLYGRSIRLRCTGLLMKSPGQHGSPAGKFAGAETNACRHFVDSIQCLRVALRA